MKLLAYAVFAISVLLFSGFARATVAMPFAATYQTPIHIDLVSLQAEKNELTLAGSLPNPCMSAPAATLTQDDANPSILILRLTSAISMETCIERIQPYMTTLDLPTLVRASRLQLDPGMIYVIKTEGYDFHMEVLGSALYR